VPSLHFRPLTENPGDLMKNYIAQGFERPLKVIRGTINNFIVCILIIQRCRPNIWSILQRSDTSGQQLLFCRIRPGLLYVAECDLSATAKFLVLNGYCRPMCWLCQANRFVYNVFAKKYNTAFEFVKVMYKTLPSPASSSDTLKLSSQHPRRLYIARL